MFIPGEIESSIAAAMADKIFYSRYFSPAFGRHGASRSDFQRR
jgi:hypothetical protein